MIADDNQYRSIHYYFLLLVSPAEPAGKSKMVYLCLLCNELLIYSGFDFRQ